MSDGKGRDRDTGEADVVLAEELATIVREVGPTIADDPRRVQGMLSDVLGAASRARRAEIDAIVSAADESIPADLLSLRIDERAAVARMHERGFADPAARFAVDAWCYALGLLAPDHPPPMLAAGGQLMTTETITERSPDATMRIPHAETATVPMVSSIAASTGASNATSAGTSAATLSVVQQRGHAPSGGRRRGRLRVIVPLVFVLVVTVVVAALVRNGGAGDRGAASTTTDVPATLIFPVESTTLGDLTRTWSVKNRELVASLVFQNTTGAEVTDRWYEVIPKDLVSSAEHVESEPTATVVKADPVLAWDLTIPADGSQTVTYRIAVGDVARNDLDRWKRLGEADAKDFAAERNTPPALTVSTPDGSVVAVAEADVSGTSDPTAAVTVNAVAATVNPDGSWSARIPLAQGPNVVTVVATNSYGTSSTSTLTITYQPPRVTTTTARRPPASTTTSPASSTTSPSTTLPPSSTTSNASTTTIGAPPTTTSTTMAT